jgi:two-component sensor histidine kinase/signal transduction histidine kinase
MSQHRSNGGSIKSRFIVIVLFSLLPFLLAVGSSTYAVYLLSADYLQTQMKSSTRTLHNLIGSLLRNSVRSYLRSKVEVGVDIVKEALREQGLADLPEEAWPISLPPELEKRLVNSLLSFHVGESGYYYGIRSDGTVFFHPDPKIAGSNQREGEPVKEQLLLRNGYLEYRWRNSDEEELKNKALYMAYIPELDWILSATSYREEFVHIIDLAALRRTINSVLIGKGGYSYVVDRAGTFIAHPYLYGKDARGYMPADEFSSILQRFYTEEEGIASYYWSNPSGNKRRLKIVNFKYIPDFDWIVATAFYWDEIGRPIHRIVFFNLLMAFVSSVVLFVLVYRANTLIGRHLIHISEALERASAGDLSSRSAEGGPREIRELSKNVNRFLEELENKTGSLAASLEEKERLLQEIQHRVKNNLQMILSLINLQRNGVLTEEAVNALEKTHRRITGMAMVYDHLSRTREQMIGDRLSVRNFLEEYIAQIVSSHNNISCNVVNRIDAVMFSRDLSIYCGMLVNELISAAIDSKAAAGQSILIDTELCDEGEKVRLTIKTDSAVFAEGHLPEEELVVVLSQQIHGTVRRELFDGGSRFEIRFPVGKAV